MKNSKDFFHSDIRKVEVYHHSVKQIVKGLRRSLTLGNCNPASVKAGLDRMPETVGRIFLQSIRPSQRLYSPSERRRSCGGGG